MNKVISEYVERNDVRGLADYFKAHLVDEIMAKEALCSLLEDSKKHIGYDEEEKPTLEDEVQALSFDSNAEAFFAGFDHGLDKALQIIKSKKI